MAQQTIGVGAVANDGTGDPFRTAMQKVNANFTELYSGAMLTASYPTAVSLEGLSLVAGDLLYATGADTLTRLAKGTAGQHLVMNTGATAPQWTTAPCFSANKAGTDQTAIPATTWTQLTFSAEEYDVGSYFASNAWTPPAGKYHISAVVYSLTGVVVNNDHLIALYKNGTLFRYLDIVLPTNTLAIRLAGGVDVVASGTDVFTLWFYGAGSGDKSVEGSASDTYFQGHAI